MSKLEQLINELCPDGVKFVPLWKVTIWDKQFNSVDRKKQPKIKTYPYLLAADLFKLKQSNGDVFLLSTGEQTGWTTEELASNYLCNGEVVSIPWGKSRPVKEVLKYFKGKFVTADNRIATSNDTAKLSNKYLYYWMLNNGEIIDRFYRGSGIKHPNMNDVLNMQIPLPPLPMQAEIVRILDNLTELTTELTAELTTELTARRQQYEYYRNRLFTVNDTSWERLDVVAVMKRGDYVTKKSVITGDIPVILGGQEPAYYCNQSNHDGEAIVISRSGAYAGFVSFWNCPIFVTDGFIIEATDVLNLKFLYHYLKNIQQDLHNTKRGGGVPHVRGNEIMNMKIPVPPLSEQKRIVEILDRLDSLCNDISIGLRAEIKARQQQYEHYRDKLLTFKEKEVCENE